MPMGTLGFGDSGNNQRNDSLLVHVFKIILIIVIYNSVVVAFMIT